MRLSAKMLKNVSNVNHFEYSTPAYASEGSSNDIYFQLVDMDKPTIPAKDTSALPEYPLRYMPAAGATVNVIFDALLDDIQFEVAASNPFPQDTSIWKVSLTSSQLPRSGNFIFELTEGSNTKTVVVMNGLSVALNEVGSC
jgi:hypothetical protein